MLEYTIKKGTEITTMTLLLILHIHSLIWVAWIVKVAVIYLHTYIDNV